MKNALFLFFLTLFLCPVYGQERLERLKQKLKKASDSTYIETCYEIAEEYENQNNVKQAFGYIDSAFKAAAQLKDPRWMGYCYNARGNLYSYAGSYSASLDQFNKAFRVYEEAGYIDGKLTIYLNKGNTFFYSGDYERAKQNYLHAQALYPKSRQDPTSLANIYNNLGGTCGARKEYAQAKEYFLKALDIYAQNKDSLSIGYAYNNLANIELEQQHNESALPLFESALVLKMKYGSNSEKTVALRNLAQTYVALHQPEKALKYMKEALMLIDTSVYNSNLIYAYTTIAYIYSALEKNAEANKYYRILQAVSAEVHAKEIKDEVEQKEMLGELRTLHLADSLRQATKIQLQDAEIKKSDTIKYSLIAIVTIILIFTYLLFKRYKISQEQHKEISRQKHLVDEKQKEILDSIHYAKRIQQSQLSSEAYIERKLKEHKKT